MDALRLNQSLAIAHYLKEDLAQIWQQPDKAAAGNFLKDWSGLARASGIKVLQTMANTLEGRRTGILNWYDFPISTGPLEGISNKNGALQRMAYDYRDHDYFIAKLYALLLAKFALIGCRRCPRTAVWKPDLRTSAGLLKFQQAIDCLVASLFIDLYPDKSSPKSACCNQNIASAHERVQDCVCGWCNVNALNQEPSPV